MKMKLNIKLKIKKSVFDCLAIRKKETEPHKTESSSLL